MPVTSAILRRRHSGAPGLFCRAECGTGHCYKYCESDSDCPVSGSTCALNGPGTYRLCSLPQPACDAIANTGCRPGFACFFHRHRNRMRLPGHETDECGLRFRGSVPARLQLRRARAGGRGRQLPEGLSNPGQLSQPIHVHARRQLRVLLVAALPRGSRVPDAADGAPASKMEDRRAAGGVGRRLR